MLTLPPCWLARTSMVETATETESVMGAISSCTVAEDSSGRVLVLKPGAVTTSFRPGLSAKLSWNVPLGAETVCTSMPTGLPTETWALGMGAPDVSTTLPLTSAAERQAEKSRQQASGPGTKMRILRLLPRSEE